MLVNRQSLSEHESLGRGCRCGQCGGAGKAGGESHLNLQSPTPKLGDMGLGPLGSVSGKAGKVGVDPIPGQCIGRVKGSTAPRKDGVPRKRRAGDHVEVHLQVHLFRLF